MKKLYRVSALAMMVLLAACGGSSGNDDTQTSAADPTPPTDPTPSVLTLQWDSPTQNVDGSPLTDLVGFAFYYGTESGNYPNRIDIDDNAISTYTFENLEPGNYYFVAIAKRANGIESALSNEIMGIVE
ncbi:MAG: fibronectin type III domain-containing protein [Pseudomonadota bacterium]